MSENRGNTSRPPDPSSPSRSGRWTLAAISVFALAVLGGLMLSPRASPPPLPAGAHPGPPDAPLIALLADVNSLKARPQQIAPTLLALAPNTDVIFLIDVEPQAVPSVAAAFGMERTYRPELSQRASSSNSGPPDATVVLLSRHRLLEGSALKIDRLISGIEAFLCPDSRYFLMRLTVGDASAAGPYPPRRVPATPILETGRTGDRLYVRARDVPESPSEMQLAVEEISRTTDPPTVLFRISSRRAAPATTATAN